MHTLSREVGVVAKTALGGVCRARHAALLSCGIFLNKRRAVAPGRLRCSSAGASASPGLEGGPQYVLQVSRLHRHPPHVRLETFFSSGCLQLAPVLRGHPPSADLRSGEVWVKSSPLAHADPRRSSVLRGGPQLCLPLTVALSVLRSTTVPPSVMVGLLLEDPCSNHRPTYVHLSWRMFSFREDLAWSEAAVAEVRCLCAWCFMNLGLLYGDFCSINRPRSIECNQTGLRATPGHGCVPRRHDLIQGVTCRGLK